MMMKLVSHCCVLLPLLLAVRALPGWPNGGTIVAGNAVQFDRDTWEAHLARPNATGNNSVVGFDVSKPWPSTQGDGWKLGINVTSDIPDSEIMNPSNATGKAFTGTSIFLQAPPNLQSTFSSQTALDETTWKICIVVIPNAPQDNVTGTAADGDCPVMSTQCVSDLEDAYTAKFARNQDCYGTPPATPSSCGARINTGAFNVQQLPLDSITGREVYVTASDLHDPEDQEALDDATGKTWPVMVIWGWNVRANASGDAMPTVQLSCVSARDVVSGSNGGGSGGSGGQDSAGARPLRLWGSAGVALVIACVVAYALL
ncbi:hypothetical protein F5Y10DRAFT_246232 [Nemania abortiva]|nr:hypothetical protein F5Y10DRAFT_246232 [Nemania abortiva]